MPVRTLREIDFDCVCDVNYSIYYLRYNHYHHVDVHLQIANFGDSPTKEPFSISGLSGYAH